MARDDADIDRLKAGIPDRYQPPHDAGGLLTDHFLSVGPRGESTAPQGSGPSEVDRNNLGMLFVAASADNPNRTSPGFMLPGALASVLQIQIDKAKQEKRKDAEQIVLDQVRAMLDARLAALDAELEAIDARLDEIRNRRLHIGESMGALSEIEERRRVGRKLDPANKADAALLDLAGLNAEEANGDDYMAAISARRHDLDGEDGTLETEWNTRMKRRGVVIAEREEVISAQAEIENADTAEARIKAERRATTVLGSQQLGDAAYRTTSQRARVIAADAVGVSAESKAYNRLASTEGGDALKNTAVSEIELDDSSDVPMPKPLTPR